MFAALSYHSLKSEQDCVVDLLNNLAWDEGKAAIIRQKTIDRIGQMRTAKRKAGSLEGFFQTYGLNTQEGIALMCLAEALLRVPDDQTMDALIEDKITKLSWNGPDEGAEDWILRMASFGLSATRATLQGPLARLGAPVIRTALSQAMKILGGQFVIGEDIEKALRAAKTIHGQNGSLFSFDMLGEGARSFSDAQRYFETYDAALDALCREGQGTRHGLSVKLSALHPRFHPSQAARCVPALIQRIKSLALKAKEGGIRLTVDAEEYERLDLSFDILRAVFTDPAVRGWDGFGFAVQAYGTRALPLIQSLVGEFRAQGLKAHIRLVKGAYWDSEIKRAQMRGLKDYPVFTRKYHTDLSYLACARALLDARDVIYPMFGTHNAHTLESLLAMTEGDRNGFEFQRLFGMGETLYDTIAKDETLPVRIYAPVGIHKDLLPYLVRRLLENGANSSFVNKALDPHISPESLSADPYFKAKASDGAPHPDIPLPSALYEGRVNALGIDLEDTPTRQSLLADMEKAYALREKQAHSIIDGRRETSGAPRSIINPADFDDVVGGVVDSTFDHVDKAFASALRAQPRWGAKPAAERAAVLRAIAHLYEQNYALLLSLCVHEAGKTLNDAVAELREAIDFCRYYAQQGQEDFDDNGLLLQGYTGEQNRLILTARGVFVSISPWNFPLAIFTGQVVAALMAGNAVIAKPAEQTPMIAQAAVHLMHKAGVPSDVLHLLQGDARIGERMVQHNAVDGVVFTGSFAAAKAIAATLAAKQGAIIPFIAETGGQNVMIADSTALPEQVVDDVIAGAFGSAGQRCSATRILCIQDDIAPVLLPMLKGAIETLCVGNPQFYETDIGPVIDDEALQKLRKHKTRLEGIGTLLAEAPLSEAQRSHGHFFAPAAYKIQSISDLSEEVFGPLLHVMVFRAQDLPALYGAINATGYALTFGIHTRLDARANAAAMAVRAGNVYINRSMIGAVVGVQPFGGSGLSGTGPKAGGPFYLNRFANEKTISINTTASGGNASLVMLGE